MRTDNLERSQAGISEAKNNNDRRKAGVSAIIGGGALMAAGLLGMMANEAETPQEALGSVSLGDRVYYVQTEELPFVALGGVGLLAIGIGIEALRRPDDEE